MSVFGKNLDMLTTSTDCDNFYYRNINSMIELESASLASKREKWLTYSFNGYPVPRTTEIINSTINKDYLNKWAAKLGSNYNKEIDTILDTGSMVHNMIEDFITTGRIKEKYPQYRMADPLKALKAYHNFLNFWNNMKTRGYIITPIAIELPFATPWYGGTIDFIAKITAPNGVSKVAILDFKTSSKISYNYFLQTEMYWQAMSFIVNNYNICDIGISQPQFTKELIDELRFISQIGIIRIDKQKDTYEYVLADLDADSIFLANLNYAASSMVNWYYKMQLIDSQYSEFKRNYIERGGINGIYNRSDIGEQ